MRAIRLVVVLSLLVPVPLVSTALAEPAGADAAKQDKNKKLLKELEGKEDLFGDDEAESTGLETLLDDIVVTATKRAQPISAAPAIISVITDRQIQQRGYRSVAEALASIPGLYFIDDHVTPNLGVRGVNGGARAGSRIIKVMIDGQPVSFRPTTENWLGPELIPIQAVRRIEVVRGPASALYGANAFLGVINVITTSGASVDGAKLGGEVGAVAGHVAGSGSLLLGKKAGNLDVLLAASYGHADRSGLTIGNVPGATFYGPSNSVSDGDTTQPVSLFGKVVYTSPLLGTLSLDASYQRKDSYGEFMDWGPLAWGQQTSAAAAAAKLGQSYRLDPNIRNHILLDNLYLRGRLSRTFFEKLGVALSGTFSKMGTVSGDRLAIVEQGRFGDYVSRELGTTGVDVVGEVSYTARSINTFTLGVDYTHDQHTLQSYFGNTWSGNPLTLTQFTRETPLGSKSFQNIGTYLQGVLYPFQLFGSTVLNSLGLTLGVRYDYNTEYGSAVNYRAGAVYLRGKLYGKALFGTSFKGPASAQLFSHLLQSGDVLPNPQLKPEKALTVEALFGGELFPGFNGTVNVFYGTVSDKVEIVIDPTLSNPISRNVAEIRSVGAEADLSYAWRGLSSYLNFSWQKTSQDSPDPTSLGKTRSEDSALFPAIMLKLGVGYQHIPWHLGAFAEARYISSRLSSTQNAKAYDPVNNKPYTLDGYFTLDLSISSVDLRLLKNRETFLQAKLSNLTGATYYYPGFRNFDVPALGRTFYFTLTQQL